MKAFRCDICKEFEAFDWKSDLPIKFILIDSEESYNRFGSTLLEVKLHRDLCSKCKSKAINRILKSLQTLPHVKNPVDGRALTVKLSDEDARNFS